MTLICPKCGKKLEEESAFCDSCGYKVKKTGLEAYINESDRSLSLTSIILSIFVAGILFFIFTFTSNLILIPDISFIILIIGAILSPMIGGILLGYYCANWNKAQNNLTFTIMGFLSFILIGSGGILGASSRFIANAPEATVETSSSMAVEGMNSMNAAIGNSISNSISDGLSNIILDIIGIIIILVVLGIVFFTVGTYLGTYLRKD